MCIAVFIERFYMRLARTLPSFIYMHVVHFETVALHIYMYEG